MDKEIIQLQNRFRELANKSYTQNVYSYTGFLTLAEQDAYYQIEQEIRHAGGLLFGGIKDCERKVLRFGDPDAFGYEEMFPITCLHISPLIEKFADHFSHRDFLGALMNLGIDRSTLGDIFLTQKEAYLFCLDTMADFISENLDKVKHTNVRCEKVTDLHELPLKEPAEEDFTVNSERIDGIIAKIYYLSREKSQELFAQKKIYIDGRLVENVSRILKTDETVSVRGFGRFVYRGVKYETKKGKLCVKADVYR